MKTLDEDLNIHGFVRSNKELKTTQMSVNRWGAKQNVTYLYKGVLCGNKRNELLILSTTWMTL